MSGGRKTGCKPEPPFPEQEKAPACAVCTGRGLLVRFRPDCSAAALQSVAAAQQFQLILAGFGSFGTITCRSDWMSESNYAAASASYSAGAADVPAAL